MPQIQAPTRVAATPAPTLVTDSAEKIGQLSVDQFKQLILQTIPLSANTNTNTRTVGGNSNGTVTSNIAPAQHQPGTLIVKTSVPSNTSRQTISHTINKNGKLSALRWLRRKTTPKQQPDLKIAHSASFDKSTAYTIAVFFYLPQIFDTLFITFLRAQVPKKKWKNASFERLNCESVI